jgi:hypothetical protein
MIYENDYRSSSLQYARGSKPVCQLPDIRALEDVSLTLWLHNHLGRAMRSQHSIGLATVDRSLDAPKKLGLLQHRITLEGGGRCSL